MRDSDIDVLSADGAQDSDQIMKWTDPRAALAEAQKAARRANEGTLAEGTASTKAIVRHLAKRGVLLVTEADLVRAWRTIPLALVASPETPRRLFAALSAPAEDTDEDLYLVNDEEADRR